ncbi:MAG TPA: HNH endonuclease [Gammaproteobacteria bacterium]|nr:HNH endonuclease [Gammaproteobacteria bacterium]
MDLTQQVLRTDAAGLPLEWIGYQEAVRLYALEQIAYTLGQRLFDLRGGINAASGLRSRIEIHSIVATYGKSVAASRMTSGYVPPVSNAALFKRDAYLCLYCGQHLAARYLSRDHVTPFSRGGSDDWRNLATACRRCNNHKAGRRPEEADMQLIAIPFTPSYAEYIYLKGRRILADQMEFLKAHFPRTSPLLARWSALPPAGTA